MPSDSEKRRRKQDAQAYLPQGIIPINMVYPRLTNIYGPQDMEGDPEVEEAQREIDSDDRQGE